jgi:hypothetical protein
MKSWASRRANGKDGTRGLGSLAVTPRYPCLIVDRMLRVRL